MKGKEIATPTPVSQIDDEIAEVQARIADAEAAFILETQRQEQAGDEIAEQKVHVELVYARAGGHAIWIPRRDLPDAKSPEFASKLQARVSREIAERNERDLARREEEIDGLKADLARTRELRRATAHALD